MLEPIRFPKDAWIPLAAGLCWLWIGPGHGLIFTALSAVPGCLLLGSGVAMLLFPGDRRSTHFAAIGGLIGAVVAVPGLFVTGFWSGLFLLGLSAWGFATAGSYAMRLEPPTEGVPAPILAEYDRLRAKGKPAIRYAARLGEGSCEGCRIKLPVLEYQNMKAEPEEALIRCVECHRVLVR